MEDNKEDKESDKDNYLSNKLNHELVANVYVVGQAASVSFMNNIFYLQMLLLIFNYLPALRKRKEVKRKQQASVHRDRASDIQFVHSWDDVMFKRQFWITLCLLVKSQFQLIGR